MVELSYRSEASADLEHIAEHGFDKHGPATGARYVAGLADAIARLVERPALGTIYRGITPPIRSFGFRGIEFIMILMDRR